MPKYRTVHPARTKRKPAHKPSGWRAIGMRMLAAGVFVTIGVGIMLGLTPRGAETSLASIPAGPSIVASRWPDLNIAGSSEKLAIALSARQKTASASAPQDDVRLAMTSSQISLSGGIDQDIVGTIRQTAKSNETARFQSASNTTNHTFQPQRAAPIRSAPRTAKTDLVKFTTAPFPAGQRSRGGTLTDDRVLLHVPAEFNVDHPAVMVVYFHGHGAELERDVLHRQQVPAQISTSGVNAVLVAPQFAVDAADSNPGRFSEPGGFARFVHEASTKLAKLYGDPKKARQFQKMPVVIVAYSGGYLAAAKSIQGGGLGKRLHGVVLLDALYGELNTFANWIKHSPTSFLVSAYTSSTQRHNQELARILEDQKVPVRSMLDKHLWRGRVAILSTDENVNHRDFVTRAWTDNPIRDVLAKLN
ncbi:MAG: alpha/beta hydrolase [Pseudolabrys sp.]